MLKNKSLLISLTLFLIILNIAIVSAAEVKIVVTTDPGNNLIIRVINPSTEAEITTLYSKTNEEGVGEVTYETSFDELSFVVIRTFNGEPIEFKEFNNIRVSETINLNFVEEAERSEETIPEVVEQSEEQSLSEKNSFDISKVTGFLISDETGEIKTNTYYIAAGLIAFIFLMMFLMIKSRLRATPSMVQETEPAPELSMSLEEQLKDAEEKIKSAQEEIRSVKEKSSEIDAAEREFKKAQEKLMRLKSQHSRITKRIEEKQQTDTNHEPEKQESVQQPQKTKDEKVTGDEKKYEEFQDKS